MNATTLVQAMTVATEVQVVPLTVTTEVQAVFETADFGVKAVHGYLAVGAPWILYVQVQETGQ